MKIHLTYFAGALLALLLVSCVSIPPQNFANNYRNQPNPRAPIPNPNLNPNSNPSFNPSLNPNPNPNFTPNPTVTPTPAVSGNIEGDTIFHVNRFRATQGLPPLQSHPGLANLARNHSKNMRQRDKMDHFDFSKRSRIAQQNFQIRSIAENVQSSWGSAPSAQSIVRQWENSPKHRDNMMGNFSYAGMGISQEGNSIFSTLLLGK